MAQRTLGALTTEALHDDFDATKYGATAEQAIKDGIVDIARRARLPAIESTTTISTVAGTRTYSLPAGVVQIVAVARADQMLAFEEDYAGVVAQSTTGRGTPTSYSLFGSSVALDPIPSTAETITVSYLGEGTIPGGSADVVTAIEDADQFLLVAFARARLFAKEDDPQMSAFWRAEYENGLRLMKAAVQRRVHNANRRVGGPYTGRSWPRFQTR